jgi:hypothetical protein
MQATVGDNSIPQPPFYQYSEKAKWLHWYKLRHMSRSTAKVKYLNKLILFCVDPTVQDDDNFWTDFCNHVNKFKIENQRVRQQEQLYKDDSNSMEFDLPSEMLQVGDVASFAPLTFINSKDEERILKHSAKLKEDDTKGREIITVGEIKQRCQEMEELIIYEIRLLKYSLRESMKRITDLEHETRIYADESDEELNKKVHTILEKNDTNKDVKKVIENVQLAYNMLKDKMVSTKV